MTSLGEWTISTPRDRASAANASTFGAIAATRAAAPLHVWLSHMSQMMIAVSAAFHDVFSMASPRRRGRSSSAPTIMGAGTADAIAANRFTHRVRIRMARGTECTACQLHCQRQAHSGANSDKFNAAYRCCLMALRVREEFSLPVSEKQFWLRHGAESRSAQRCPTGRYRS